MIEIIPISRTSIDWSSYIKTANLILDLSITAELDARKIKPDTNSAFNKTLKKITNHSERHIHYGFLIIGSKDFLFRLLEHQSVININVVQSHAPDLYLSIATATVKEWKEMIIICSSGQEPMDVRSLANRLQAYLENEGFYDSFFDFSKQRLSDGTNKLCRM